MIQIMHFKEIEGQVNKDAYKYKNVIRVLYNAIKLASVTFVL